MKLLGLGTKYQNLWAMKQSKFSPINIPKMIAQRYLGYETDLFCDIMGAHTVVPRPKKMRQFYKNLLQNKVILVKVVANYPNKIEILRPVVQVPLASVPEALKPSRCRATWAATPYSSFTAKFIKQMCLSLTKK